MKSLVTVSEQHGERRINITGKSGFGELGLIVNVDGWITHDGKKIARLPKPH